MVNQQEIAGRIEEVRARIDNAARRAGRPAESVRIVAVTKTHPVDAIVAAVACGITDIGENRVQEAAAKFDEWRASAAATDVERTRFHLIGHLQTNKARIAARDFDLIHSVDSLRVAEELNRYAVQRGTPCAVLLQVNVSSEESKSGMSPAETPRIIEGILNACPEICIQGFMTMAPLDFDQEAARPHFSGLRNLADQMSARFGNSRGFSPGELSMGMTSDFEAAVEEGATLVRIGSAIFGSR